MSHYKPYPEYKESGVVWIGKVPEHWELKPLKYSVTHNDDVLPDYTSPDEQIRYVDISSVTYNEGISKVEEMSFSDAPSRARRKARSGDVIVSTVRTYLKAVASVDDEFEDCTFSTGFAVLRPRPGKLKPRFLKWLVLNDLFIQSVEAHSEGLSYPAINPPALVGLKTVIPAFEEQNKIAEILEAETSRIDSLITKKTRFIELLKEKRQALITHAVTKGLNPDVKMKDSGVEWIGEVPEHWKVGALRWYSSIQSGVAISAKRELANPVKLPYLRVANVQDGYLELNEIKHVSIENDLVSGFSLRYGDVLMNEGGDNDKLGRGTVWREEISPCLHQNHVFAVRPSRHVKPEWLAVCSQTHWAKSHFRVLAKQSTNLASISSSNIKELKIPVPLLIEQESILSKLNSELERLTRIVELTNQSIALLKERRSAFITAAVTGQIDLRGEPA